MEDCTTQEREETISDNTALDLEKVDQDLLNQAYLNIRDMVKAPNRFDINMTDHLLNQEMNNYNERLVSLMTMEVTRLLNKQGSTNELEGTDTCDT